MSKPYSDCVTGIGATWLTYTNQML
jgi:hypothetical protein